MAGKNVSCKLQAAVSPWSFQGTLIERNTLPRGGEEARSLVQGEVLKVLEWLEQSLRVLLDFPEAKPKRRLQRGAGEGL